MEKRAFKYSTSEWPWLERYEYYQNRNDLLPFWYASEWVDLPLEQGAGGEININIGHPFWGWDICWRAQQNTIEDQITYPSVSFPALEFRLKLDGQQAWGSWADTMLSVVTRGEIDGQLGEGYILERGSFATIEYRRVVGEVDGDAEAERIQFILGGAQIWPKGSLTTPSGWRNQTMADWSQKAVTSPYRYATRIESDNTKIGDVNAAFGHVPLTLRTRDRDFIWERMYLIQYATTDLVDVFGIPYMGLGAPVSMTMLIQDIPVHGPAPQGVATFAFHRFQMLNGAPFNSRALRIPRLIAANSLINIEAGFWWWPTADDYHGGDMTVLLTGSEIIAEDRTSRERKFDLS